jgi:histidine triad (HIT) family protein
VSACVFCRIVRGEVQARVVHQDDDVTAFHDINPRAPVHVLIVPNRHISGVAEVEAEDEPVLGRLLNVARQLAEQLGVADGYRLVVNNGPLAGQTVFHLHVHLLGGRAFGWPPG